MWTKLASAFFITTLLNENNELDISAKLYQALQFCYIIYLCEIMTYFSQDHSFDVCYKLTKKIYYENLNFSLLMKLRLFYIFKIYHVDD
jgi:hypothetical protein